MDRSPRCYLQNILKSSSFPKSKWKVYGGCQQRKASETNLAPSVAILCRRGREWAFWSTVVQILAFYQITVLWKWTQNADRLQNRNENNVLTDSNRDLNGMVRLWDPVHSEEHLSLTVKQPTYIVPESKVYRGRNGLRLPSFAIFHFKWSFKNTVLSVCGN